LKVNLKRNFFHTDEITSDFQTTHPEGVATQHS
jgi:hypothetical protein